MLCLKHEIPDKPISSAAHPEQVRNVQHQRVKYACPCCYLGIKVTPALDRIIVRRLLTESALAWFINGKNQYGVPQYRQATQLRRFGEDVSIEYAGRQRGPGRSRKATGDQPDACALLESELIYGD